MNKLLGLALVAMVSLLSFTHVAVAEELTFDHKVDMNLGTLKKEWRILRANYDEDEHRIVWLLEAKRNTVQYFYAFFYDADGVRIDVNSGFGLRVVLDPRPPFGGYKTGDRVHAHLALPKGGQWSRVTSIVVRPNSILD